MLDGIAKTFRENKKIIFVGIQNHCENLKEIVKAFDGKFIGNRDLLEKAASKHDLWKYATMNPEVIINERGNLFVGHGSEFPSYLVVDGFDEIEFDRQKRIKNFPNYYILNLIRLHHSGFSTFNLYSKTDFIYEAGNVRENMTKFIRDWYALKTADWIDSSLMASTFKAREIFSLIDLGLKSEVDLGKNGDNEYYIIPEDFIKKGLKLAYHYVETDISKVKEIIRKKKTKREQRTSLNDFFVESEKETIEVIVHGH